MAHVYLISGLGADQRVFDFLELPGHQLTYINWVNPLERETLKDYCERLTAQIDLEKEVVLIGVSFGGIVAQEIAALIPCKKTVIISSVKSETEIPFYFKCAKIFRPHRFLPPNVIKKLNLYTANYFFGVKSKAECLLLKQIILDTDAEFLKWAIEKILNWRKQEVGTNLYHIHGKYDKIFPSYKVKNAVVLEGGHFIIVSKAKRISPLIQEYIEKG